MPIGRFLARQIPGRSAAAGDAETGPPCRFGVKAGLVFKQSRTDRTIFAIHLFEGVIPSGELDVRRRRGATLSTSRGCGLSCL
jgi:hypothetical protein